MLKNLIAFLFFLLSFQQLFAQRMEMMKNEVSVTKDEMTAKEIKKINLSSGSFKPLAESSIGLTYTKEEGYILYSYLYKTGCLSVESVMIKIDGVLYEFKSGKEKREVLGQYCSEKDWYNPSSDFIDAFKKAKVIKYRLNGNDEFLDFDIKASKLLIIPDFFN